ncbi:hypothetical protein [Niveibacterium sp. SC-1]|uniref:hypothetical protein n=1 Tax=Niveibacterium sp. SC-1 TaxID=3135646 RepID=UPI00311FB5F4
MDMMHRQFFGDFGADRAAESLPFVEDHDVPVELLDQPLTARARTIAAHDGGGAAVQYEFSSHMGQDRVVLLHTYLHADGLVSLDSMGMAAIGRAGAAEMRHELSCVLQRAYQRSIVRLSDD